MKILLLLIGFVAVTITSSIDPTVEKQETLLTRESSLEVQDKGGVNEVNDDIDGRFRRSPEPENGHIEIHGTKQTIGIERGSNIDISAGKKIWENKNGHISVSAGGSKRPGQRWDKNVGIGGEFRFRRSAEPGNGRIEIRADRRSGEPNRGSNIDINASKKIWEGKNGRVDVTAGSSKRPGQRWDKNVGIRGEFRFRRAAEPGNGRVEIRANRRSGGPDRGSSIDVNVGKTIWEGKNGHVGVTAGGSKRPGQKWDKNVGIGGEFRFRRSTDEQAQEGEPTSP